MKRVPVSYRADDSDRYWLHRGLEQDFLECCGFLLPHVFWVSVILIWLEKDSTIGYYFSFK
eukprot:snap_masked-scaffold_1-processed-gene-6.39-mRNA-1 protein AED:1.00 eAED:1.00 QI:0/0/0/0/1/1/2/0/60